MNIVDSIRQDVELGAVHKRCHVVKKSRKKRNRKVALLTYILLRCKT